jgi:hypothetical protein
MYCTFLSPLSSKRLSKNKEHHHGAAACCASSSMAYAIEVKALPNHVCNGMVEGTVEGFYLIW